MDRLACLLCTLALVACASDPKDTDSATGDSSTSTGGTDTTGSGTGDTPTGSGSDSASGTDSTGGPSGSCGYIVGKNFISDEELGCGFGGPCHWNVRFASETEFEYNYSDVSDLGTYNCEGDVIVGMGSSKTYMGTVDAENGTLLWENVPYTVEP